ncbi:serine kinase [Ruegeria sp. SCPT10]|uniref:HPr kinase/phosphorylase n=1 Tax=Ruegeria sp. SCP10 TaxID=3141377 RepID=UPI00333B941E
MTIPSLNDAVDRDSARVHASCVVVADRGLLILGASGAGKSSLALQMMALGAHLVADDRVDLEMAQDCIMASPVPEISGLIEARGIGLLRAQNAPSVVVHFVLDLDQEETARLPDPITIPLLRHTVPLLRGAAVPNLAPTLVQLLRFGRVDPEWPNK